MIHFPMSILRPILLVEDNPNDVELTLTALRQANLANEVIVAHDGEEALDFLFRRGRHAHRSSIDPSVVFLDLKLPMMSGHEVLAWIRAQRHLESLVVVVLTSSSEPSDLRRAYSLGANSYLVKPLTAQQLLDLAKALQWPWLRVAV